MKYSRYRGNKYVVMTEVDITTLQIGYRTVKYVYQQVI